MDIKNKVVVIDQDGNVQGIKNEADLLKENAEIEAILNNTIEEKEKEMPVMMVENEKDRSLKLGVVGLGQAGGRVAEVFYNYGYQTVIINTAIQDLKHIQIPDHQKMLLEFGLGGAGKNLDTGAEAVIHYSEDILNLLGDQLGNCEVLVLCSSGGGGTGSGGCVELAKLMNQLGKLVISLFVLPMASEDALSKSNTINTLAKLAQLAASDVISSLILCDNAKIEMIYPGQSMGAFWKTANKAIVEPLHMFNALTAQPSSHISLDPTDFANVVLSGDCALYGMIELDQNTYTNSDTSIAEAMVTNLEGGLLASGFNLKEARKAGVVVVGSAQALESISASNMEYGFAMVSKVCGESVSLYRGVYEDNSFGDTLRIYTWLGGLGLPADRVNELKDEASKHMQVLQQKEEDRGSNMRVDLGKNATVSAADKIHQQIKNKNSAVSKLTNNVRGNIVDRRKR